MKKIFTILCLACAVGAQVLRADDLAGVYSGTITIDGTAYTNETIYLLPGTETNTVTCVVGDMVRVNVPESAIELSAQRTDKNYDFVNGGFEGSWSSNEPTGWHSFVSATGSFASLVNGNTGQFTQSTDTRPGSAGSHSARLQSKSVLGVKANGNCTNGRINAGSMSADKASENYNFSDPSNSGYNTPFVGNPDSLVFWAKYIPADQNPSGSSNKARAHAVITTNARYQDPEASDYSSVKIADAEINYTATGSMGWQRLSVPFRYYAVSPDQAAYMLMTFTTNATQGGGTTSSNNVDNIYLDDVEMVYNYHLTSLTVEGTAVSFNNGQASVELPFSEDYAWVAATNAKAARTFIGYDEEQFRVYVYVAAHNYAQTKHYEVYQIQMKPGAKPAAHYDYEASTCAGVPYSDENFSGLTESGVYHDTISIGEDKDSIVSLTLTMLPTYLIDEEMHIMMQDTVWHGQEIKGLAEAEEPYLYYDSLQTLAGCDSIYRLSVYVSSIPRTYGLFEAKLCEGDSVAFDSIYYYESFEGDILLEEKNIYGGDSIVHLSIRVLPNYTDEEYLTMIEGDDRTWESISLRTMPAGTMTLRVHYFSVEDCDSTRLLHLTVLPTSKPYAGEAVEMDEVYGRFDGLLTIGEERLDDKSVFVLPGTKDSTITFVLPDFSFNGGQLGHVVLPNIPMNGVGQLNLEHRTFYLDTIRERASITLLNGWKAEGKTYYSVLSPTQAQMVLYIETPSLPEAIIVRFQGDAVRDHNYSVINGGFEGAWSNNEPAGWHSFGSAGGEMADFVNQNTHLFVPAYEARPDSKGTQSALISSTVLLNVNVNGNCTNGQIHVGSITADNAAGNYNFSDPENEGFTTPFHGRPDSIVFWAKYLPADRNVSNEVNKARMSTFITTADRYQDPEGEKDFSEVKIGAAAINYAATPELGWQRIAVPFTYEAGSHSAEPAYILTTFTTNYQPGGGSSYNAGDKHNKQYVLDSVYVDDVEVVFNKQLRAFYQNDEALAFENHVALSGDTYCDDCDRYTALTDGVSAKSFIAFDPDSRCIYVYVIADDYAQSKAYNIYRIEFSDSQTEDLIPISGTEGTEEVYERCSAFRKELRNGRIVIVRENKEVYDVLGRKIQ